MTDLLINVLIMILSVVVLIGGGYLLLVILGWGLKLKSGHREQEGLSDLWAAVKRQEINQDNSADQRPDQHD
jgi:hypothetical protein